MVAVRNENIEIVRVLLQAKADVNARSIPDEKTALILAVVKDNREIVELLIESGADVNLFCDYVDVNVRDNDGGTALFYAVQKASMAAVHTLINAGAEVNIKDNNSQTPLFYVGGNHGTDLISLLIKAGANPNERNKNQESALFDALRNSNLNVVKALFHAGADLNARNIYGKTPLFYTIDKSVDVIAARFLLENGAQFNQRDGLGSSVLSCFMENFCDYEHEDDENISIIDLIKEFEITGNIFTSVIKILYTETSIFHLCRHLSGKWSATRQKFCFQ